VLKVGILPYAADDGGEQGQAHRSRLDLEARCCSFAFRAPDQAGDWSRSWTEPQTLLPLPDPVVEGLQAGAGLAPTLREIAEADGTRYAVLDLIVEVPVAPLPELKQVRRVLGWDWGVRTLVTATVVDLSGNRLSPPLFLDTGGFDGRQAHTRRHLDRLKHKVAELETRRDQFVVGDPRREPSQRKLAVLRREMARCWRKYEARNNDLAHLAANMLLLLASVWQAELIAGESLKSLKSEGRGRGARGRWVHWRTNAQIRGALWRVLRYKCHLSGQHLAWQHASGTTHTCPHCGKPAHTYASPALDCKPLEAGAWLRCLTCGWNGARDYAAAINIALLGVAALLQDLAHSEQRTPLKRPTMTTKSLNSESYMGSGLARQRAANTLARVPRERKAVRQWLDQRCHSAFRILPRHLAAFVRIAVSCDRSINLDLLLSNGTNVANQYQPMDFFIDDVVVNIT
jgi:putative transposase